ncbi:MAG: NHL repeat-containing protein, partial [Sideroxyarcus sp.]|nr:NHL repeat-containing protein [Sideroxyarcus sp.]
CCAAVLSVGQRSFAAAENALWHVRTTEVIVGPKDKPFKMPTDAAVGDNGDLYVLDGVNDRVVVYDMQGNYRFQFGGHGNVAGQFIFPIGIATGPDGKVYVADSGNHRFQIFTAGGKPLESVALPAIQSSDASPDPTDVALDAIRSRLYIADNDNHRLDIYNLASHRFEEPLGSAGLGQRQFRFPFLIDTTEEGYVLVVEPINTRVQVISPSGKFVSFVGAWGVKPGQLFRPKGVASMDNHVYVSDSVLGRIQVFELRGAFLGTLADNQGLPVQFVTPTGVAIDKKNKLLYVVELKADQVCRIVLE